MSVGRRKFRIDEYKTIREMHCRAFEDREHIKDDRNVAISCETKSVWHGQRMRTHVTSLKLLQTYANACTYANVCKLLATFKCRSKYFLAQGSQVSEPLRLRMYFSRTYPAFFVARISNPVRNKNVKKIHVQESALTYYDGENSKSLSRKSATRVSAVGYE